MSPVLKITLPVIILSAAGWVTWMLWTTEHKPDEARRQKPAIPILATVLRPQSYTVYVPSQGEVRPRTQSTVIPEVSGVILSIAPSFRDGAFFEKDDELLKLDERDYLAAITIAQSAVAQAETLVTEEKARAAQALEDWKRLGREGEPGPLVMRKPQVDEAVARVDSAKAQLERAKRDLARTSIKAPYAGYVVKKAVDVGQYVTPGRELAQILAVDFAEIDLALVSRHLEFLDLPEQYRGETVNVAPNTEVKLTATHGGRAGQWKGRIVRTAAGIDRESRQLYVTAQVEDPYARRTETPPLKMGIWVDALITGRTLRNVFVIPDAAVREGTQVLVVDKESKLRTRTVKIVWREHDHVVVSEGLSEGETLCTVSLHYAVEGAPAKVQLAPLPAYQGGTSGAFQTKRDAIKEKPESG